MNAKHRKTLGAIFTKPTTGPREWARIEALFLFIGCKLIEGRGSQVRFVYDQRIASFHRLHPDKDAKPYQVEDARAFLESIGVRP